MKRFCSLMMVIFSVVIIFQVVVGSHNDMSMAQRVVEETIPTNYAGWKEWYQADQHYLKQAIGTGRRNEVQILKRALENFRRHPDHLDARGFKVYSPETTGKMQMLAAGIASRVPGHSDHTWLRLYGNDLRPESKQEQADINEAINILQKLPLQSDALKDFELYLMPYSMGDTSGFGGNGYAFIAAVPNGVILIPNQLQVTLVHEVGHHLHLKYMSRTQAEGLERWNQYLKLRGIPWSGPGAALTKSWSESSEEVFSEDFRVWVSTPLQEYFGDLAYPNPSQEKGKRLRAFFLSLPESTPVSSKNPWSVSGVEGLTSWVGWAPILFILPLGLVMKKRPYGREVKVTSSCL